MRAVCYPRVSSLRQRERHTIASQLRLLPEFISRMGWQLVRPVNTYVDDGYTAKAGKLDDRKGFEALMRDAARGAFDVVVVMSLDRLTRSEDLVERGAILGGLQRAGIKVADAMTGQVLDFSTDAGDMMGSIQAVWASMERRRIREKTMEGKVTAAHQGRKPQGPTPYGLAYNRETRVWSIDPVRGPILLEIFQRTVAGDSARMIANDFNARGVPAPREFWERGRIHHLIKSRHAIGEWVANRERGIVIKVPAIVDRELWERAQAAHIDARTRPLRQHTKHIYLLERMATCAACGSSIVIRTARGPRKTRYLCVRRREEVYDRVRCYTPTITTEEADGKVWAEVAAALRDPKLGDRLLDYRTAGTENRNGWKADVADYKKRIAKLQASEAALVARFGKGLISEATMDGALRSMKRDRDALTAQLKHAEGAARSAAVAEVEIETLETQLAELRELAATATPEEKRELVRRFVEPGTVVFHGNEIRFTLWFKRGRNGVSEQRSSTWTQQADVIRIRLVA